MRSLVKIDHTVSLKNGTGIIQVPFTDLCRSGCIVNAINALVLAAQIAGKQ